MGFLKKLLPAVAKATSMGAVQKAANMAKDAAKAKDEAMKTKGMQGDAARAKDEAMKTKGMQGDAARAKDEAMKTKGMQGAGSIGMLALVKKQGKGMGPIGKLMQARATKTPMFKKGGAVATKTGKGKAMGIATRGGGRALMKGK